MAELPTTNRQREPSCGSRLFAFTLPLFVVRPGYWLYDQWLLAVRPTLRELPINQELTQRRSRTHMHMLRSTMLVTLLSPSAAFHLGQPQVRAPRPTAPRLSPVVAADKPEKHATVIFLRHGQSEWNAASLFTGWADVPLTTLGKNEAAEGATQMWREGYKVDVAYTSLLKRAQQTLDIVLKITGQEDVPVHQNWRLNERMYA